MSLRRAIAILLVGIGVTLFVTRGFEKILLALSTLSETRQSLIGQATHGLTYRLEDDKWVVFDIPAGHGAVRLVVNAACSGLRRTASDDVRFAVRYQIHDKTEQFPVREETYSFKSKLARRVRTELGSMMDRLFFVTVGQIPTDGRSVLLDLNGMGWAAKELWLQMDQRDERATDILVRLYYERPLTGAKQKFRWDRLSRKNKQRLTRSNVYTHDLITSEEQDKYCKYEWAALAPRGVVGRDYNLRLLYRRKEFEPESQVIESISAGLRVAPGLRGIIAIPEGEHRVTLSFRQSDFQQLEETADDDSIVRLRWYGRSVDDMESFALIVNDAAEWSRWLTGGLLEIESTSRNFCRAFIETGEEITPSPTYVRAFICEWDRELRYDVSHVGDLATPMRFDLRAFGDPMDLLENPEIDASFDLLDGNDKVIESSEIADSLEASVHDQVLGGRDVEKMTEPRRVYFNLPRECASVRVRGGVHPLLVTVFNRVPDAPKIIKAPEDYYAYSRGESRNRGWFVLQPRGQVRLRRQARSRALKVQARPPRREAQFRPGGYRWRSLRPTGQWAARSLLVKKDLRDIVRRKMSAVVYSEIATGEEEIVDLWGGDSAGMIDWHLIYMPGDTPGSLRVEVDAATQFERDILKAGGQLILGEFETGQHLLRVSAPPGARVFLSHIAEEGGASNFLKRRSYFFGGSTLSFQYERDEAVDESLLGHIYLVGGMERASMCVTIRGFDHREIGPHDGWTFEQRYFDIRPGERGGVIAVHREWAAVNGEQRFVIPLFEDLPAGAYIIDCTFQEPARGYMTLAKIVGGRDDIIRFSTD